MRALVFPLLAMMACSKTAGSAAPSASATAPAEVSSAPAAPTIASAAPAAPTSYAGAYTSKEGTLHVPDGGEWSGVKWRGDDAGVGLGEGALTLTIDPKTGRAEGTGDGALGPVLLSGVLQDGVVSFTVARKERTDDGLTGAGIGKLAGDKLEGTMNLSLATASVIREASFSLSKR